ncbi:Putative fanconi anemia group M protein [Gryllus bimaculatus]|nr:Putative fanconi anemia group M protein [Gryllus bimaculatus]
MCVLYLTLFLNLCFLVSLEIEMTNTLNKEYVDLLEEQGEDQLLLNALEESIRFYQEVEVPRQRQREHEPGPSRETSIRKEETSKAEKQQFVGMDENGFDKGAGRTWIYPTNYPIRDYQFNIVQSALFKNTLVSLPTGLGKTFIAAVVMYNFYRWYPEGKVLFLAPTRPLVAQQIDSCYKVMGIPKNDTAEMTGQMPPNQREVHWKKCRLFFLTPQSLMSDLMRSTCPVQQIRCIVIDEAHRATKNYAYCQVIQAILPFNKYFRVLALSATPGNDMEAVQQVLKNLLIEHVEVRDEQSSDTAQYTNERTVDTIVVRLEGFHKFIEDSFCQIIGTYLDVLLKWKLVYVNARNVSKYALMMARNKFRSNPPPGVTQNIARQIEGDFFLCMSLAHGLELLNQHGLRNLFRYLKGLLQDEDKTNPASRARLLSNKNFEKLLSVLEDRLGETDLQEPDLNTSIAAIQTQSAPPLFSHPKMEKLREVVINHFQNYALKGEETRVMVFCQYRDTVVEVCHLLARLKPLVKVMSFVGQSTGKSNKGLSQKQQLQIMERFRRGGYNTLISTSIGEEGLDIGEVDLIVCYDAHASPIRLVQRMGRTGRKRQGRIVMLLTEGKENKKYHQSLTNRKSMNSGLVNSKQLMQFLYKSPRMVPSDFQPECYKMFMSMPKISRDRDVRKMLMSKKSNASKENGISKNFIVEETDLDLPPDMLPETKYLHSFNADELLKYNSADPQNLCPDVDWLLCDNATELVSRSTIAKDLQELLEFAARRRCDVPLTQTANMASQVNINSLWPRRKRKNAAAELVNRKAKQKRLTTLWTQDNAIVSDNCEVFVDNPILETIQTTEHTEENMVDILQESFIMSEHILSKMKELEEGIISCCRISRMFKNSGLSDFLVGFEKGDSKAVREDVTLADSGYFDDLLNPDVWENYNSGRKQEVVKKSESFADFDELLDPDIWENSSEESKQDKSPKVTQGQRRKVRNYLNDDHYFSSDLKEKGEEPGLPVSDKDEQDHYFSSDLKEMGREPGLPLSYEDEEVRYFSSDLKDLVRERSLPLSYEDKHERNLGTDMNIPINSESTVADHKDIEPNFDIGISQLLNLSPDLSLDITDVQDDTDCVSPSILRNGSQKKFIKQNHVSNMIPLEEDGCNKIVSEKEVKSDNVAEEWKEDQGDLSNFVDEAILKWLGSSEEDFEMSASLDKSEKDITNISRAQLSPIISSQRKKPLLSVISSSTPKPEKIQLDIKKNDKKDSKRKKNNKNRLDFPGAGGLFIEDEAEESREDRRDSSDGENTSGLDELDDSFVDDEERTVNDSVDIQAHYLLKAHGQFKIKEVQNFQGNVYSQALTEEELKESYEEDSFCVSTNSEESDGYEEDTLDIIEAVLKKKTKRKTAEPKKQKGRKRIRVESSSSNEDMDELRNIPPTQIFSGSPNNGDVLQDEEKEIASSSPDIKKSSNKRKFVSESELKSSDPKTKHWNDDDCLVMDDCFVRPNEFVAKRLPCVDKQAKQLNKFIGAKAAKSSICDSEFGTIVKTSEPIGVRKQLKFSGNNADKKTLLTDFFLHKANDKRESHATAKKQVKFGVASHLEGMEENRSASGNHLETLDMARQDASCGQGKLVVITASRQVVSAPEIITSLKARHNIVVHVHSVQTAHYVVSPYVGVVRVTAKDIAGNKTTPLLDVAKNLTSLFQQAYFIIELSPSENTQKGFLDLSVRLRNIGIRILYSDRKASTADMLANLCCREFSCGHSINLPKSIKDSTANFVIHEPNAACNIKRALPPLQVVSFFEGLPGVNIAMAFDLVCRFKTIADFINRCKSVPDIRQILGINRERARKIYFLLRDVL